MLYDIHISLNMREKRFTFQIINQRIFHRFGLFNTFQRRRQTTFRKNNWLFNFRKVKSTESIINFLKECSCSTKQNQMLDDRVKDWSGQRDKSRPSFTTRQESSARWDLPVGNFPAG